MILAALGWVYGAQERRKNELQFLESQKSRSRDLKLIRADLTSGGHKMADKNLKMAIIDDLKSKTIRNAGESLDDKGCFTATTSPCC